MKLFIRVQEMYCEDVVLRAFFKFHKNFENSWKEVKEDPEIKQPSC